MKDSDAISQAVQMIRRQGPEGACLAIETLLPAFKGKFEWLLNMVSQRMQLFLIKDGPNFGCEFCKEAVPASPRHSGVWGSVERQNTATIPVIRHKRDCAGVITINNLLAGAPESIRDAFPTAIKDDDEQS